MNSNKFLSLILILFFLHNSIGQVNCSGLSDVGDVPSDAESSTSNHQQIGLHVVIGIEYHLSLFKYTFAVLMEQLSLFISELSRRCVLQKVEPVYTIFSVEQTSRVVSRNVNSSEAEKRVKNFLSLEGSRKIPRMSPFFDGCQETISSDVESKRQVRHIVLVTSDGYFRGVSDANATVNELKKSAEIFVVSVGGHARNRTLLNISSGGENLYKMKNIDQIVSRIIRQVFPLIGESNGATDKTDIEYEVCEDVDSCRKSEPDVNQEATNERGIYSKNLSENKEEMEERKVERSSSGDNVLTVSESDVGDLQVPTSQEGIILDEQPEEAAIERTYDPVDVEFEKNFLSSKEDLLTLQEDEIRETCGMGMVESGNTEDLRELIQRNMFRIACFIVPVLFFAFLKSGWYDDPARKTEEEVVKALYDSQTSNTDSEVHFEVQTTFLDALYRLLQTILFYSFGFFFVFVGLCFRKLWKSDQKVKIKMILSIVLITLTWVILFVVFYVYVFYLRWIFIWVYFFLKYIALANVFVFLFQFLIGVCVCFMKFCYAPFDRMFPNVFSAPAKCVRFIAFGLFLSFVFNSMFPENNIFRRVQNFNQGTAIDFRDCLLDVNEVRYEHGCILSDCHWQKVHIDEMRFVYSNWNNTVHYYKISTLRPLFPILESEMITFGLNKSDNITNLTVWVKNTNPWWRIALSWVPFISQFRRIVDDILPHKDSTDRFNNYPTETLLYIGIVCDDILFASIFYIVLVLATTKFDSKFRTRRVLKFVSIYLGLDERYLRNVGKLKFLVLLIKTLDRFCSSGEDEEKFIIGQEGQVLYCGKYSDVEFRIVARQFLFIDKKTGTFMFVRGSSRNLLIRIEVYAHMLDEIRSSWSGETSQKYRDMVRNVLETLLSKNTIDETLLEKRSKKIEDLMEQVSHLDKKWVCKICANSKKVLLRFGSCHRNCEAECCGDCLNQFTDNRCPFCRTEIDIELVRIKNREIVC